MASLRTRLRWHTGYSADSVEWCPVAGFTEFVVCGTYQLHKDEEEAEPKKQQRLGRIYLFKITSETSDLVPIQTIETSGVLDQKWCCHLVGGNPALAVVTSEGFVQVYKMVDGRLDMWVKKSVGDNLLALSVDWSSNKLETDPKLVVSDSSGRVSVLDLGDQLNVEGSWEAHGFEAWIAAFNYWSPNVFYTGGDDCVFRSFDLRVPEVATSTNRSHGAGVTAIRSHVDEEHQLLTGSYDEIVRLWDPRQLKRCVTETNVNGGIWRLKWHPTRNDVILAACMYGGFRILHLKDSNINIACEYLEHESIAYGADWKSDEECVGTCSFYDCKFHLSDVIFE